MIVLICIFLFDKVNGWASLAWTVDGGYLFQVYRGNYIEMNKKIPMDFSKSLEYANVVRDNYL